MTTTCTLPITERQRAVLRAVVEHLRATGRAPSYEQVADAVGLRCTSGAIVHVAALRRKGYLSRDPVNGRVVVPGTRLTFAIEDTPEGRRLREALGEGGS